MDMCRFSGVQDREYSKVIAALDRVKTRVSEKKADTESSGAQATFVGLISTLN